MFAVNPGVLAAGSQMKTYADFLASIEARKDYDLTDWNSRTADSTMTGAYVLTVGPVTAVQPMYGSPWLNQNMSWSAPMVRVVQHSCVNAAMWDKIRISASRVIVVYRNRYFAPDCPSVYRNGYSSAPYDGSSGSEPCFVVSELSLWDNEIGAALTVNPELGSGPFPYAG